MSRNGLVMEVVIPISRKRARIDQPGGGSSPVPETRKRGVVKGPQNSALGKCVKVQSGERASTSRPPKRTTQKKKDSEKEFFLSFPYEILTEILSWSYPSDLLALTRTTKQLRRTLLHKSAVFMWNKAEGNLAELGLPACPPHMTEPEYAALLFTKYCTVCGTWTDSQLDLYLYVRLCGSCRRTQIAAAGDFEGNIRAFVPCSTIARPQIDNHEMTHYCFLRDARRAVIEREELVESGDVAALEDWECEKQDEIEDRFYHGMQVSKFLRKWEWDEKAESVIAKRRNFIRAKVVLGNSSSINSFDNPHHSVYLRWEKLVEKPKSLNERGWEKLRPVLNRVLKESWHESANDWLEGEKERNAYRLSERLLEIGNDNALQFSEPIATFLGIDHALTSASVASTNEMYELMLVPFPNLKDALELESLYELMLEGVLLPVRPDVIDEIDAWRKNVMQELHHKVYMETKDIGKLTVKGSDEPAMGLSPVCRRLLRADCVFRASSTHPLCNTLRIGASYSVSLPLFFPDLLVTRREDPWDSDHFQMYPEAVRVATALLKCLGMEDAAHVEMKVMGCRFVCKRCDDRKARDWNCIIGHYLEEQRRHKHVRGSSSFRHGLAQTGRGAMVEIVPAECVGQVLDMSVLVPVKKKARRVRGCRGFY